MPSSILNALGAGQTTALPGNIGNLLGGLNQFRQMVAPVMTSGNPAAAARALLIQRGLDPDQIMRQFGAQATEIQRQLMGGK